MADGPRSRRRSERAVARAALLRIALIGLGLTLLVAGCAGDPPVATSSSGATSTMSGAPGGSTTGSGVATEADLNVEVVAEGLVVPWEIRLFPDGALLVTERPGRILRVDPATGAVTVLGTVAVAQQGEGGLLGVAIDPGFPARPYLYVAYTHSAEGTDSGLSNRVSRFTLRGDTAAEEVVLVDDIPGAWNHDGSRVAFGPDGYLWVTTGDAARPDSAQDLSSPAGKVLRMDTGGLPAPGNPFGDSLVYSYGHRNPQGLAWRATDTEPFVTEHGPSENDEVNHIQAGGDFGWPLTGGAGGGSEFVDPVYSWTPTIAPAGAVFYESDAIPGWRGSLLLVTLKESDLRRLTLTNGTFTAVAEEEVLFDGRFGRLRSIAVGPNGELYVGTSNRDGRGDVLAGDDKILRISAR
ncbi:MAG: PQQ-dependent sugar dehydrogenase [Thermoleophilia bacterium]